MQFNSAIFIQAQEKQWILFYGLMPGLGAGVIQEIKKMRQLILADFYGQVENIKGPFCYYESIPSILFNTMNLKVVIFKIFLLHGLNIKVIKYKAPKSKRKFSILVLKILKETRW